MPAARTRVVLSAGSAARVRKSVGDLLRSLAAVFAFVVLVLLVSPARELVFHGYGKAITTVAYQPQVTAARYFSHLPMPAPVGLPAGWRATSARDHQGSGPTDPTRLHIGFITPEGRYAELQEAAGDAHGFLVTQLGKAGAAHVQGTTTIGGVVWQLRRDATGAPALTRQDGGVTIVILGGDNGGAALPELRVLAASLRP